MTRIAVTDKRVRIAGAVGTNDARGGAIVFRRLDDRWRHEFPIEVDFLAESPSGVRLVVVTDSPTLGLEFLATRLQTVPGRPALPSRFDLVADGAVVASATSEAGNLLELDPDDPTAFELVRGEVGTVELAVPESARNGPVELWLPPAVVLRAHALLVAEGAHVEAPPPSDRRRWVHHGSSISHGMEAHGGARTWPAVAARLAGVDVMNLGLAGQCQLDQFAARTIRDLPADVLSLKCGINLVNAGSMTTRTFPSALHGFLDTVREGHPGTPFVVASPIICPEVEDTTGPTTSGADGMVRALGSDQSKALGGLTLRLVREIVADVVETRRRQGDTELHHLDGLALFADDDVGDLPDGIHPNGAGHERIGERFAGLAFGPGSPLAPA